MKYIFSIILVCFMPALAMEEQNSLELIYGTIGKPISKEDEKRLIRYNLEEFEQRLEATSRSILLVAVQRHKQLHDTTYYYAGLKKVETKGSVAPIPIATVCFNPDRKSEEEKIHLNYVRAIESEKNDKLEETSVIS